jgi:hypothetical protein
MAAVMSRFRNEAPQTQFGLDIGRFRSMTGRNTPDCGRVSPKAK